MHLPFKQMSQSNIRWKSTHTEPSFLLLKTKQWTNADRSVTVATATPHVLFELHTHRKSLKFLPHHLHWKDFPSSDETWIGLFDGCRVTEHGESNLVLSFQGYDLNGNVKTCWGGMMGLIYANKSVKWANSQEEGNESV